MTRETIKFEIEFAGFANPRIDEDGTFLRPATAAEISRAIAQDLEFRVSQLCQRTISVTVKKL